MPNTRKSASRRDSRLLWVRNNGLIPVIAGSGIASESVLFDPQEFSPAVITGRADIGRTLTVMHMRLQVLATLGVTAAGTTSQVDLFFGVNKKDRGALVQGPNFTALDSAQTDWMDSWFDIVQAAPAAATYMSQGTLGCANERAQRVIKTRRVLESRDLVNVACIAFPHAGTYPGISTLTVTWLASILIRVG